ncbi:hypothetical protein [Herpetosiphon llansteffanensis]|uniref:hypothetical protein n=1 Tax=Herpetosiphon llansteffanensis TaxID=2094568 RepID=UPI000D7BD79F|nr:hypothetical protein [Herpetosiphon llansteffanensis]
MDMRAIQNRIGAKQKSIEIHKNALAILEQKVASFGSLYTPPYIELEIQAHQAKIQQYEYEIHQLNNMLATAQPSYVLPPSRVVMVTCCLIICSLIVIFGVLEVYSPDSTLTIPSVEPVTQVIEPTPVDLAKNGSFTSDWNVDWEQDIDKPGGNMDVQIVDTGFSESGKALHLTYSGDKGGIFIKQSLDIPDTNVNIHAQVNPTSVEAGALECEGLIYKCTGYAGLVINMYGENKTEGDFIAQILYVHESADIGLKTQNNRIIKRISSGWSPISINLDRELRSQLPGMNTKLIKNIDLIFFVATHERCKNNKCMASMDVSDVKVIDK